MGESNSGLQLTPEGNLRHFLSIDGLDRALLTRIPRHRRFFHRGG